MYTSDYFFEMEHNSDILSGHYHELKLYKNVVKLNVRNKLFSQNVNKKNWFAR